MGTCFMEHSATCIAGAKMALQDWMYFSMKRGGSFTSCGSRKMRAVDWWQLALIGAARTAIGRDTNCVTMADSSSSIRCAAAQELYDTHCLQPEVVARELP